jgi:hypothetical protein
VRDGMVAAITILDGATSCRLWKLWLTVRSGPAISLVNGCGLASASHHIKRKTEKVRLAVVADSCIAYLAIASNKRKEERVV